MMKKKKFSSPRGRTGKTPIHVIYDTPEFSLLSSLSSSLSFSSPSLLSSPPGALYSDRLTYRIMSTLGLLRRRIPHQAELHQTRQLFELLPTAPNGLWQMDVTYVHLPRGQRWYIVSVIDYYSRYLLTCSLTPFQNAAAVSQALSAALQEAARVHGPLQHAPILVTDNGACFLARKFQSFLRHRFRRVRIRYRTPQQLG